ncbi:MAG: ZIP family metal transporter [Acidimicrobiales bacterium]|nr:ZIP family metal transporter [Acidimicrobiales bacterium]
MRFALLAIGIFVLSMAAGVAPLYMHGRIKAATMQRITGVSSGLLLASALLIIVPEGFHVIEQVEEGSGWFTDRTQFLVAMILVGFIAMLVLEGLGVGHSIHEEHHDHSEEHGHGHLHHPESTAAIGIGLTVHAAADGLAIGSSSASDEVGLTALVALAVILHKAPAAFSLGAFLSHTPQNRSRTLRNIGLFALATPVFMLVSRAVLGGADALLAGSLLFSAGTFLYVATVDTLPRLHSPESGRSAAADVIVGAMTFAGILLLFESFGWIEHVH